MDRIAARFSGSRDDLFDIEVSSSTRTTQRDCSVSAPRVERTGVVFGKDRHGANSELSGGADDANGDFAAVGDEQ